MQKRIAAAALGRVPVSALLASASLIVWLGVAEAGSLTDSVRAALQANPEIGVVKADRRAVDQELRLARAGYLPSVDLQASVGQKYSSNGSRNRFGRGCPIAALADAVRWLCDGRRG